MKKIIRKIGCIVLTLILITSVFGGLSYAENSSDQINVNVAKKVALLHIIGDMKNSVSDTETWETGVYISKTTKMYDLNKNVTAYLFELKNKDKESGYIIVGANKEYNPIIEFAYLGEPFIYSAINNIMMNTKKGLKSDEYTLLYLNEYSYFIELNYLDQSTEIYDISVRDYKKIDKSILKEMKSEKKIIENNKKLWEFYLSSINNQTVGFSDPPDPAVVITNPNDYETDYDSKFTKNVPYYIHRYKIMDDFVGYIRHCAPTAGTNLMLYWYNRSYNEYSDLKLNGSWNDTFEELYSLMGTTSMWGTFPYYCSSAYEDYFFDQGLICDSTYYSSRNVTQLMTEINSGYPYQANLHDHDYYTDHAVVAIGYVKYEYLFPPWSSFSSVYLRIVDGEYSYPYRYVHTVKGVDYIGMNTLRPN